MQAPVLQQGQQHRMVTLPGTGRWMDVNSGAFISAGRSIQVSSTVESTPMYLLEGSLVPMQIGERTSAANDLSDIELHVILGQGSKDVAVLDYVADDGLSYGYQRGERSHYRFEAWRNGDTIEVAVKVLQSGWKPLRLQVVAYDGATVANVAIAGQVALHTLQPHAWRMSGGLLQASRSEPITIQ